MDTPWETVNKFVIKVIALFIREKTVLPSFFYISKLYPKDVREIHTQNGANSL